MRSKTPKSLLLTLWTSILDFVLPPYCSLCSNPLGEGEKTVCQACWSRVEAIKGPFCTKCGNPLEGGTEGCLNCQGKEFSFTGVRALTSFGELPQRVIHLLKYRRKKSIGERLGRMLADVVGDDPRLIRADLIVPVPLHRSRERERGYNQSELIARSLGDALKKPVYEDILVRRRRTRSQATLSAVERRRNVSGAFLVERPEQVEGRRIALVDDVVTTGATADACSEALLDAGAEDIFVVVVASPFSPIG